jgi:hypothetical protein
MEATEFNSAVWQLERFGEINKTDTDEFVAYIRGLQRAVEGEAPEGTVLMTVPYQLEAIVKNLEKLNTSDIELLWLLVGKLVRYNKVLNDEPVGALDG